MKKAGKHCLKCLQDYHPGLSGQLPQEHETQVASRAAGLLCMDQFGLTELNIFINGICRTKAQHRDDEDLKVGSALTPNLKN